MVEIVVISVSILLIIFKERLIHLYRNTTDKYFTGGPVLLSLAKVYENVSEIYYSHKVKDYLAKKETTKFYVGCTYSPAYFYNNFKTLIDFDANSIKTEDTNDLEISAAHELKAFEDSSIKSKFPANTLIDSLRTKYFNVMEKKEVFTHFKAMSKEHPNPENSIRFLFVPFDINSFNTNTEETKIKNEYKTENTNACLYFFEKILNYNITCSVICSNDNIVKDKISDFIILFENKFKAIWNYNISSKELLVISKTFCTDPNPLNGTQYGEIIKSYEKIEERNTHFIPLSRFREQLFN